ncbi:unnamed protein product [Arctogadus glacialis]
MLLSLCLQEEDKRQLRESSAHPTTSERYGHTFRELTNFSGTINVTYRYLAGTPLNRKKYLTIGLSSVKRKLLAGNDQVHLRSVQLRGAEGDCGGGPPGRL